MTARDDADDPLSQYRNKRDFSRTPEPSATDPSPPRANRPIQARKGKPRPLGYVVQKHWAGRLHYDLRLEVDGVMKSWAVPKGPSLDPSVRRMAVQVEDHPLAYNTFEGTIPKGEYGGGRVIVWDTGTWSPEGDAARGLREGKLKFELQGKKLRGRWTLVRTHGGGQDNWLLIKETDAEARATATFDVTERLPDSALNVPSIPETLEPQLATRVATPPTGQDWQYELKYDGYRILARMAAGQLRLYTRRGHDWTARLPTLAHALESAALQDGWYDGEVVVLDHQGKPDFQALQNVFEQRSGDHPVYFLFDLPWLGAEDLRPLPLVERQARLAAALSHVDHPDLRLSAIFDAPGHDLLASACTLGLEGIIGKRRTAPYVSGRSSQWIKLKCSERQEFVIGGFTRPKGGRKGFGALLLGLYDEAGHLRFAGNVGTGFNDATLAALRQRMAPLEQQESPFFRPPRLAHVHWLKPALAAEVAFSEWTRSGRVRQAVFIGLREDKPPTLMKKESARQISSPDRVVDASSDTRKIDVVSWYERAAPLLLPHLKDRPVALLRAPDGIEREQFFQKHMETRDIKGLMQLDPSLDPGHEPLVVVRNEDGLAALAQLNVIEFHTWNAVRSRIDRPNRITFDLDPGKGVAWPAVQEAALLLRNFLEELGLTSFVKTSGGKGLHVVVPLARRHGWDSAKGFSRAVVQHMAEVLPRQFSAKSGPRNRVGKIFIDYLRNGFGATTVAAWSLRARPGMGVSVPISWEEVETVTGGDHWHIGNAGERLETGNTPWEGYQRMTQSLGAAMKRLGYRPEK